MQLVYKIVMIFLFSMTTSMANASLHVPMRLTDGNGKDIGSVRVDDTIYGLLLTPNLHGLRPGIHGIHIHELPFCANHAQGAGGHLNLSNVDEHNGPYEGNSHSGDLPVLIVNEQGRAKLPILAPRLKLSQIVGRSLIITARGDNYSDYPRENGGGGARLVCGVIPYH